MALEQSIKGNKKIKSNNSVVGFFKDFKGELKRITWPSKEEAKKSAVTVITFCIIYAAIVGSLDFVLNRVFSLIFK